MKSNMNNNYLKNRDEFLKTKLNQVIHQQTVSNPINDLLVRDIQITNELIVPNEEASLKNIFYYYRLLSFDQNYNKLYNEGTDFEKLLYSYFADFNANLRLAIDTLKNGKLIAPEYSMLQSMFRIEVILNRSGNNEALEELEKIQLEYFTTYEALYYQKGKEMLSVGHEVFKETAKNIFSMFQFHAGVRHYSNEFIISHKYDINNSIIGPYGVPFKVDQRYSLSNMAYADVYFFPLFHFDLIEQLKGSYLHFTWAVLPSSLSPSPKNSLDESTKFTYINTANFQSIKERTLTESSSTVSKTYLTSYGINLLVYDFSKIVSAEVGYSFDNFHTQVESQYAYHVNLKTKYLEPLTMNEYNFNEKTELLEKEYSKSFQNIFVKLKSGSLFGFQVAAVFGSKYSYFDAAWGF